MAVVRVAYGPVDRERPRERQIAQQRHADLDEVLGHIEPGIEILRTLGPQNERAFQQAVVLGTRALFAVLPAHRELQCAAAGKLQEVCAVALQREAAHRLPDVRRAMHGRLQEFARGFGAVVRTEGIQRRAGCVADDGRSDVAHGLHRSHVHAAFDLAVGRIDDRIQRRGCVRGEHAVVAGKGHLRFAADVVGIAPPLEKMTSNVILSTPAFLLRTVFARWARVVVEIFMRDAIQLTADELRVQRKEFTRVIHDQREIGQSGRSPTSAIR